MRNMDKTHDRSAANTPTRNPLGYALMAVGILLLGLGMPLLFAASEVSRLIGGSLGEGPVLVVLGLLVVVSGASLLAFGLRRR
jgi:hypothetical protein